jgi:hypothetical protein
VIPWLQITVETEYMVLTPLSAIAPSSTPVTHEAVSSIPKVFVLLYALGTIVSFSVFGHKLYKLINIIGSGEIQWFGNQQVVVVNDAIETCSFFKYIIISKANVTEVGDAEIAHERSHIAQYHSVDIMLAWIFQSLFWFHPITYLYRKRLMEVHEFLADADAINLLGKTNYQEYLLQMVSQKRPPQLTHNFNSITKTRLMMMNSNSTPNYWSYLISFAALASMIFFFSCETRPITKPASANDAPQEWLTETVIDTIITIDSDTYEEAIALESYDYQYTLDTAWVFDPDTKKETFTIVKNYRDIPRKKRQ